MPGLEPGTPRLEVWCAIQLRHTGKVQYPVIETGAIDWKSIMLPLHQYCYYLFESFIVVANKVPVYWDTIL